MPAGCWLVFEVAGLVGMITTRLPHRSLVRRSRRPLSLLSMLLCGLSVYFFGLPPGNMFWLNTALLMSAGFFVYVPQALVAVVVANLATKRAAANGRWLNERLWLREYHPLRLGMGKLVELSGWGPAFGCIIAAALAGAALFAAALPAKAHGYGEVAAPTSR